jgi:hypothetical protein
VVRCIELYLRTGGRFGFVMPLAALSRRQFAGFRAGRYRVNVAFSQSWDLHAVKRADAGIALAAAPEEWSGRLPMPNASWEVAARYITRAAQTEQPTARGVSPYAQLVRPLQARGEHNPRDFDKYIFRLPIPLYDPGNSEHRQLAELAERAEEAAAAVELPAGVSFQAQRRRLREALSRDGVSGEINNLTTTLLAATHS